MKKEDLSVQGKKGVSEIVSYTLLIIIAVGASVLVYTLLSQIVPKPNPGCPSDTYLIIKNARCSYSNQQLNVTMLNKGLFSVDAVYVRIGSTDPKIQTKTWISNDNNNFYFGDPGKGLAPNQDVTWIFNISIPPANNTIVSKNNYTLELQPAMWDKDTKKIAACESKVVQIIDCN
jgi:hypothetical protein